MPTCELTSDYGGVYINDTEILGSEVPLRADFDYQEEEPEEIWVDKPYPGCPEAVTVTKIEVKLDRGWVELDSEEMRENLAQEILDCIHEDKRNLEDARADWAYQQTKDERRYA